MFRFILGVVLGEKSIFVGPAEVINFNHMSSLCLFCVHTKGKQCMDGHKTSNDNIGLNQNFLPFVVMVWTLQRVQWNLSYEHQHVSNEIEIQPGSSNVETDPCVTSLFSPWYAPRIRAQWRLCQVPIFGCLHILSQTQPHFPFASSICGWFHINHFWSFADQNWNSLWFPFHHRNIWKNSSLCL